MSLDDSDDVGTASLTEKSLDRMRDKLERLPSSYRQADFNPFVHVLDIIQSNDPKKAHSDLERYCRSMDIVRKDLVDVYFQHFNKAIRNYTSILAAVNDAKAREQQLHESTSTTAQLLRSKSTEVSSLYAKTLNHEYMVKFLDQIEELKQFPARYATYISELEYLKAAELLVNSHAQVTKEALRGVGALSELGKKITEERDNFHKTLVEALHAVLYQKSTDIRVIVAIDDDGKPGFSRAKVVLKETVSADQSSVSNTVLEKQQQQDKMRALIDALWSLERARAAINTVLSKIRPELRLVIQDILVARKSTETPGRASILKKHPVLPALNHDASIDFAAILKTLFKKCKSILSNHNFVVGEFRKKFESEEGEKEFQPLTPHSPLMPHGPVTADRSGLRHTTYNVEHVWVEFQKELQALLGTYINAPRDQGPQLSNEPSSGVRLFSFAASSAFTKYEDEEAGSVTYADFDLGKAPSVMNLPAIYPLVVHFNDSVIRLTGAKDPTSLLGLRHWVDEFVRNTFLKHVRAEVKRRIDHIVEGADMFKPPERSKAQQYLNEEQAQDRPLMKCAREVCRLLHDLHNDILAMPQPAFVIEFQKLMVDVLVKFKSVIQQKFTAIFGGDKETLKLMMNEKYRLMVMTDPRYRRYSNEISLAESDPKLRPSPAFSSSRGGNDGLLRGMPSRANMSMISILSKDEAEEQELFEENEMHVEENLYKGQRISEPTEPLKSQHLVFDNSALAQLASLHDSLFWLVTEIEVMAKGDKPSQHTPTPSGPAKKSAFIATRKDRTKSKTPSFNATYIQTINLETRRLAKDLRGLSELCLLALRTELRLWVFTYLDDMRKTSFALDNDYDRDPHPFVAELGNHFTRSFNILASYLPRTKIQYLYGSLPCLCSSLFIKGLAKISYINEHGIAKIMRDTFFLSQVLQNILDMPELIDADFDRVRKYYEMLLISPTDLMSSLAAHISERSNVFTLEEVTAVMAFLSPHRTIPNATLTYLKNLFSETYVVTQRPQSPPGDGAYGQ